MTDGASQRSGDPPRPIATGTLDRSPFAHVLLDLLKRKLTGTLVLFPANRGEEDTRIVFHRGVPVSAHFATSTDSFSSGLLRLFIGRGKYGFYEGVDLTDRDRALHGIVDPVTLVAESIRGPRRDDVVDQILGQIGEDVPLRLVPDFPLKRLMLEHREVDLVARLERMPATTRQLTVESELDHGHARALVYLLLVTRAARPAGPGAETPRPTSPSQVRFQAPTSTDAPAPLSTPPRLLRSGRAPALGDRPVSVTNVKTPSSVPPRSLPPSALEALRALEARRRRSSSPVAAAPLAEQITRARQSSAPPPGQSIKRDFQRIEGMMNRGAWDEALQLIDQLLAIDQDEPDFHAARAWCLFNLNRDLDADPSEMLLSVNAALKKHPKHDKALFYKGLIYKRSGDLSRAMGAFYQACQANRTNIDAKRELRLLKQLGVKAKITR